ncbi:hypothetical protein [Alkalibacterium pelagium]|nr:hypothetical protein [Alkalibacterium pelagium]
MVKKNELLEKTGTEPVDMWITLGISVESRWKTKKISQGKPERSKRRNCG